MTSSIDATREDLVSACRAAARERLVVSTSGNFSVRLEGGETLITRSGVCLADVIGEDLVVVDASGSLRSGSEGARASIETPMHTAVYAARRDAAAILHCQSPFATLLACRDAALPEPSLELIPEIPAYVRKVASVEFRLPGTKELAEAVSDAFSDPEVRVVQLRNHGQLVIGESPEQAVQRAAFFELAASLWVRSRGEKLDLLTADEVAQLRDYDTSSPDSGCISR